MVNKLELSRPVELGLEKFACFPDAVLNTNALVWNCGWDFGSDSLTVGSEDIYIGESTANVNAKLVSSIHSDRLL
jgi:hypothetical protein